MKMIYSICRMDLGKLCIASMLLMLLTGCGLNQESVEIIDKLPKQETPAAIQEFPIDILTEISVDTNRQDELCQIDTEVEQQEELSQNSGHTEKELSSILVNIQEAYIYRQWFQEDVFGIPNNYYDDRIKMTAEDLNEAAFYEDQEGNIYFIPTSMVNKVIDVEGEKIQVYEYSGEESAGYYLYSYDAFEIELKRVVYPKPARNVKIYSWDVKDKLDEFHFLGIGSAPFPESIPEDAAKLYENEYFDAAVEIIHSMFHDFEWYGKYEVYIGEYTTFPYEEYDYNILITVAIVGEDTRYWWIFRGKDELDENGRVILQSAGGSSHSFLYDVSSDVSYDQYYATETEIIVELNRLAIPLTVNPEDVVHELGSFKDEDDLNTIYFYLE